MNDFEMIVRQFYGGHDITIIPIADVHLGSQECAQEKFERFVQLVADTPNTYLLLGGDLINNSTRSSVGSPFTEVLRPFEQKRLMANILAPVRDRILCAVQGNHERRSNKDADDDPMYDIMAKLDLEDVYRENIAILKIQMGVPVAPSGQRNAGAYRPTYHIVVTHGSGGGYLPGASINRGQRYGYIFDGMDALVVGHTHQPNHAKYRKIQIDSYNNKITMQDFKVVIATSWLDYAGYAVQKMLYPAAFAEQTLQLSGKTKEITVTMR